MSPPSLYPQLEFLYGAATARSLAPRLEALVERHRPLLPPKPAPRRPLPLSQRDAILISYPDQVQDPGVPPLEVLARFAARHLRPIITGIHLLPFYPWSSDDGFSVKDFFEVDPAYGSWDNVARLRLDFQLMFDAVFNHVSARSEWFRGFLENVPALRDFFITADGNPDLSAVIRPRALPLLTEFSAADGPRKVWTTFSADQVDLNFRNPEVLLACLEALLFYASKGARWIRLDAIAFLWKQIGTTCLHLPQTHRLVQLMRTFLDQVAPHILLITETNVPHADNVSYFGDGHNEAQLVYNFALPPLVLHSFHAGSAEKLSRWAQSLTLPSDAVTFFNFLASHDGIGLNPVRGILSESEIDGLVSRAREHGGFVSYKATPDGSQVAYEMNINYLDALSNPSAREPAELVARKFLTAQAVMLSLQGLPGIYFHSLFGSRGDRAGAETSGIFRRINRQKFDWATLEGELADPASFRARLFNGYCELLQVRQSHPALAPGAPQEVLDLHPGVFALLRRNAAGTDRMLCLHNLSSQVLSLAAGPLLPVPEALPPFGHRWLPI